jgi:hypothetical protein
MNYANKTSKCVSIQLNACAQESRIQKSFRNTIVIEGDTHAEFVHVGQLNNELSPFLQEVLDPGNEN